METMHLSDDNLLDRLYGLAGGQEHLAECPECRRRWLGLMERRAADLQPENVAPEVLAELRNRTVARLEQTAPGLSWDLVPALAGLAVLAAALLIFAPAPRPQPTRAAADSQFFVEIESLARDPEPRAADPIKGLFQE